MNFQLEKRGHRVWRLRCKDEAGKRCSRTIHGLKKKALRVKADMIVRLQGSLRIPSGPPTIDTLNEMLAEVKYNLIADKTQRNTRFNLKRCKDMVDNRIDMIGIADIQYAMARMKQKGLANSTINQWVSICRGAFKDAIMYGLIDSNPFKEITKLKKIIKPINVIYKDDEDVLFKTAPRLKDKCIIALALYGGLRATEISSLNIRTDIYESEITVRSIDNDPTKSGKSRTVTMPENHLNTLHRYCNARLSRHTAYPFYATGCGVSMRFYDLKKRAKVACTLHDLRRTCASRLANNIGLQPWHLMDYMGHSDIKITQTYYRAFSNKNFVNIWAQPVT